MHLIFWSQLCPPAGKMKINTCLRHEAFVTGFASKQACECRQFSCEGGVPPAGKIPSDQFLPSSHQAQGYRRHFSLLSMLSLGTLAMWNHQAMSP